MHATVDVIETNVCIYMKALSLRSARRIWMFLKRGTEVWERVVSGNLHKNPKWRSKKRERERRRQRKEFVPWLKSGGDEIANQTHILRLRFEQVVCFFDIQPVSCTI